MKILLIDDQAEVRGILATILKEELGAVVVSCEDPIEALPYLEDESLDLIISDYSFPSQNGLDFYQSLVNDGLDNLPFLLITGMSFDKDDKRILTFKKEKKNRIVLKPFDEDELIAVIKEVTDL